MTGELLAPGAIFARDFRIVRKLASGGMGLVYVAEQLSTARERALKIMLGDIASRDEFRKRFEQEAKIGARIESEHIVEIVGAGLDDATGFPWLAMELLQGSDLASYLIAARGRMDPIAFARELFNQFAHGLAAAHDKQIVHRDLKPENLFLAQSRRSGVPFTLKILDFGIAKLLDQTRSSQTSAVGTPLWMAPEQTQPGMNITPATDVWAVGLIAFRVLVDRPFWRSASDPNGTSVMVLRELLMDPIPAASVRAQELGGTAPPAGFDAWFAACVERDPRRRYPDARAAFGALEAVLGGAPGGAPAWSASAMIRATSGGGASGVSPYAPTNVTPLGSLPPVPPLIVTGPAGTTDARASLAHTAAPQAKRSALPIALAVLGVLVAAGAGAGIYFGTRSDAKPTAEGSAVAARPDTTTPPETSAKVDDAVVAPKPTTPAPTTLESSGPAPSTTAPVVVSGKPWIPPVASSTPAAPSNLPKQPSKGSVSAALASIRPGVRACVVGQTESTTATINFGPSGAVKSVSVGGWAAGKPAAGCVIKAASAARVEPFTDPVYRVGATY